MAHRQIRLALVNSPQAAYLPQIFMLSKWVKRKYKKRGRYVARAIAWLGKVAHHQPEWFAHWRFGVKFPAG
jgi:hypothetical protein